MPHRVAIYTRISTHNQTVENQLRELREVCRRNDWEVVAEYKDEGISGAKGREDRKALDEMMKDATRKKFDRVMVWSVDRLGRSLKHLVNVLDDLNATRINVYAHSQGIDTATPTGRMMWNFLSIFSEFEREMIKDRIRSGINRARAEGKHLGRPRMSVEMQQRILELRAQGMGQVKIGRMLGVGTSQVQRLAAASGPAGSTHDLEVK